MIYDLSPSLCFLNTKLGQKLKLHIHRTPSPSYMKSPKTNWQILKSYSYGNTTKAIAKTDNKPKCRTGKRHDLLNFIKQDKHKEIHITKYK